jgi:hypothetical protein
MNGDWQILCEGRIDYYALNRFILSVQTELKSIDAPLIAMEQSNQKETLYVEMESLNMAVKNLERYRRVIDQLLEMNIESKGSESSFKERNIVFWLVGGAVSLSSFITATIDSSEKSKRAVLWCNSALITLVGLGEICRKYLNYQSPHKEVKTTRRELEALCREIRTIQALRNSMEENHRSARKKQKLQLAKESRYNVKAFNLTNSDSDE